MKNPLNKRLPRELKTELGKYIILFLFLIAIIGFISGFFVASGSLRVAYDESFENKELPKITPLKEWTGNDDTKKSPSIDKFEVSDNWNLTAKSSGGKGKLQYMFYYSLNGVKEIIKNYGEENYVEGWKPKKSGYYDLYVKVKDEFGNITEKKVSKGYMESGPIILYFQADKLSPQPFGTKKKLSAEA